MLETLLKERIRAQGPISVADYMALALAHPEYGYYRRADPLGAQGDFITAPEISQVFGEIIGAWLAQQWILMGKPKAIVAELGPGRGTLMSDALRATKNIAGFHDAISVHLVETSPALKQKQWQALGGKHPHLHWHEQVKELPKLPLLLVANEFFDALPVRQFIPSPGRGKGAARSEAGGGYRERMITLDSQGHLQFSMVPCLTTPSLPSPRPGEGFFEICEPGLAVMQQLAAHIVAHNGATLIIDYGYTQGSRGDTLQAVKQHRYHDVLKDPGTADLTAHVDFAALAQVAHEAGAAVYGPMPQGIFLHALGAPLRIAKLCERATPEQKSAMLSALERLTSHDQMGDLFKVLCVTHPNHPRPEAF